MEDKIRNSIMVLTRDFYDSQEDRKRIDGRLGIKKSGEPKKLRRELDEQIVDIIKKRREEVYQHEVNVEKEIKSIVRTHPLWESFLKDVKGCGEVMAAVIITEFDIERGSTVSKLWSYAGLAPGKDRLVKGQKCTFNQFLRAKLCGVLGASFLKARGSFYSEFYYNYKNRLQNKNWGNDSKNPSDKNNPKAGHQNKAAIRYMIKMFLKDLYVAWRMLENLPVRPPYQEEYLGKKH